MASVLTSSFSMSHTPHISSGIHSNTSIFPHLKQTIKAIHAHCIWLTYSDTPTLATTACGIKAILPHLINSQKGLSRTWHGVHFALLSRHLSKARFTTRLLDVLQSVICDFLRLFQFAGFWSDYNAPH